MSQKGSKVSTPNDADINVLGACVSTKESKAETGVNRTTEEHVGHVTLTMGLHVQRQHSTQLVALGNIFHGATIHCVAYANDVVRVSVEKVIDGEAEVPFSTDEIKYVKQALHTFIAWPTPLVKLVSNEYKVMLDNGVLLAVKRIKDWGISKQDFERRMNLIAQVKHPRVLPPVAYYCSQQEKLLAYKYLQNGSLFMLLYGSQSGHSFDWGSRLNVAAKIAEALAYVHEEFLENGIAHGNLKSSNILFGKNMDPCISEYGLMMAENQDQFVHSHNKGLKSKDLIASIFKADVHAFGSILLELLTGKVIKNDGFDLVKWVNSVVREEWTFEVFDKSLISQGASEERMMSLLQVALKCVNPSPNDRPSMSQVAEMTNSLIEEEEKSISFDT
ncbi:Putative inactive receptor kinase [Glycine soja]|uniref:Putative inactive receptor kinase n=1 Tax=Glycine soja TaxID=3848 RepID=A0A0B2PRP9_GLYSO|nr:Putative inactive receptor kinase [Glycine soja]